MGLLLRATALLAVALAAPSAVAPATATAAGHEQWPEGRTPGDRAEPGPPGDRGRFLYERDCAFCHGPRATGSRQGPPLVGVGSLSARYWVGSGRMPVARPELDPPRRDPAYSAADVDRIVAYVGRLAGGPGEPRVDPGAGDVARGERLFRESCAACHGGAGQGAVGASGRHGPRLRPLDARHVAAAVRLGPGPMPSFQTTLDAGELNDVVAYVMYLQDPRDEGGLPVGREGPVPEGILIWLVGLGFVLLLVRRMGRTRSS
jgi:ubiquinol-cytochrome c reductase cytochrome c subunit